MTRYDITQWTDFVRGLTSSEQTAEMEEALAGSKIARKTVAALQSVVGLAAAEAEAAPPEWVVRNIKAMGSLRRHGAAAKPSLMHKVAMALRFDSLTSPALAGIRDVHSHDRQLVFESCRYRVDMRLESEADRQRSILVGQLVTVESETVRPVADAAVLAMAGDDMVGSALTGKLGEFQSDRLPKTDLDLFFVLDDENFLHLRVADGEESSTPGGAS